MLLRVRGGGTGQGTGRNATTMPWPIWFAFVRRPVSAAFFACLPRLEGMGGKSLVNGVNCARPQASHIYESFLYMDTRMSNIRCEPCLEVRGRLSSVQPAHATEIAEYQVRLYEAWDGSSKNRWYEDAVQHLEQALRNHRVVAAATAGDRYGAASSRASHSRLAGSSHPLRIALLHGTVAVAPTILQPGGRAFMTALY
jgi:hypothetical protein